uniref:Putative transforming growth factor beta bone morphoproteintic protein n=1 Tax=Corethrella appendiculata TaxID=1370023 RepID=U5EVA1_9DIPT
MRTFLNIKIQFILFLILNNILIVWTSISGIYVDNGLDQTIMERSLTNSDQQEIEHEILELLGLPDRPKKRHIHPSLRKSAPQFLMSIYKKLSDESNPDHVRIARSVDETENLLTDEDKRAIDQSDIIMTFLNKNHHVSEVRHERGRRLWFDTTEIGEDVTLLMAELRLYQNQMLNKYSNKDKQITISAYAITKLDGEKELELLSEVTTTSNYEGWLEINVTKAMNRWIRHQNDNKGLYIGAYFNDNPEHEIKLDDIGLINSKGNDEFQPFLVGYCKGQQIVKPVKHNHNRSRIKRNAQRKRKKSSENRNPLIEYSNHDNHKSCQIKTLYVSFKDLKWQDWIIAPEGYGAFYCSGECNFPLNAHMNATNHAIVQTLVHLMHPSKVPKPCCAPTKLTAISVLYHIDDANVNLKKYKNMVVKSCGCH